jgi:hypothetical protein
MKRSAVDPEPRPTIIPFSIHSAAFWPAAIFASSDMLPFYTKGMEI